MATINSINSNIPIEISKGGTNTTSLSTTYGVIYYDGTSFTTVASLGTSGQALTSNGAGVAPSFQTVSGGTPSLTAAFRGNNGSGTSVTGDGTEYTISWSGESFDVGGDFNTSTGTFTAPSTNKYYLSYSSGTINLGSQTEKIDKIVTSNRNYQMVSGLGNVKSNTGAESNYLSRNMVTLADMDASDTATTTVTVSGGTKTVNIQNNEQNYFIGYELL